MSGACRGPELTCSGESMVESVRETWIQLVRDDVELMLLFTGTGIPVEVVNSPELEAITALSTSSNVVECQAIFMLRTPTNTPLGWNKKDGWRRMIAYRAFRSDDGVGTRKSSFASVTGCEAEAISWH